MSLLAPNAGDVLMLRYLLNQYAVTNKVLHLYNNDAPIDKANSVLANITEDTEAGYAPITLVGSLWTFATVANVTTAYYSQVAFTFTTGASVYGYFVTSTTASELLWIERFSGAPFTLPSGGGTIAISPKIGLN